MRKHATRVVLVMLGLAGMVYLGVHWYQPSVSPSVTQFSSGAAAVVAELSEARAGLSVSEWRETHPEDEWHKQSYDRRADGAAITSSYCVWFARMLRLPDGTQLTRRAVFYPPDPPRMMALPTRVSAEGIIENECTLGVIETRLETDSREKLAAAEAGIHAGLSSSLGEPVEQQEDIFPIFEDSSKPVWAFGEAQIVIGGLVERKPAPGKPGTELTAYAYLPNFQYEYQHQFDRGRFFGGSVVYGRSLFELARQAAAWDDETFDAVYQRWSEFDQRRRGMMDRNELRVPKPVAAAEEAASALKEWLETTRNLPPQQRAGALVAAHCVLGISWAGLHRPGVDEDELRAIFETAGAQFTRGPNGLEPAMSWLKEALQLDPDGPMGGAIRLASLAAGRSLPEPVPDEFKRKDTTDYVIEQGTKLLSQERDPLLRARAEYYLAAAYCDRIARGGRGNPMTGAAPTAAERHQGELAMSEALNHFRAMLALDDKSEFATASWRSGWRLLAGLPVGVHYSTTE